VETHLSSFENYEYPGDRIGRWRDKALACDKREMLAFKN